MLLEDGTGIAVTVLAVIAYLSQPQILLQLDKCFLRRLLAQRLSQ
jgi:hypothetical protein